jgi:Ca2+-binding EF-hand superfamily protein
MKFTSSALLAAALLLGALARVEAQPAPPARQPFGTGELPEFLKIFDLDNDGALSVEERQAYFKAIRNGVSQLAPAANPWDSDGDGKLSDAEKISARDTIARKIADQRSQRFEEIDTDGDGLLTPAEIGKIPLINAEQAASFIARLDKDGDGKVSKAEFLAAMTPVDEPIPACPLPIPGPPATVAAPIGSVLAAFDTDEDEFVSPDEQAAGIKAIDANADGQISPSEWKSYVLSHLHILPVKLPGN